MTNEIPVAHPKLLNDAIASGRLRIGLPMWYQPQWCGQWLPPGASSSSALTDYAGVFGTIEGNTTFYALPSEERARQWLAQVPEHFRFSFKIPKQISHAEQPLLALQQYQNVLIRFVQMMAPRTGVLMLQLPASFHAHRTDELLRVLDCLRAFVPVPLAVECRHISFFDKREGEQRLLRGLADREVNRVVFDSRGLFADESDAPEVHEARQKKPRMPVHPIATGQNPVVRFIGSKDWQSNERWLMQWQSKLCEWLNEGREPYVFLHTAGNGDVPGFASWVMEQWGVALPPWAYEQQRTEDLFGRLI